MFVDISDLINEVGVSEVFTIIPITVGHEPDEYGTMKPVEPLEIKNVHGTFVETRENGYDANKGSYVSRTVFDFYIPYRAVEGYDLAGATIVCSGGRRFTVVQIPISRKFASHSVYRAVVVGQ